MNTLINPSSIKQLLSDPNLDKKETLKTICQTSREYAIQQYFNNPYDTLKIMHKQRLQIDCALRSLFPKDINCCLLAIGGYGRTELYPYSDLDLLILTENLDPETEQKIHDFMHIIWYSGYKIGHSVRSVDEVMQDAKEDSHFLTSIIETRLLSGNTQLYKNFIQRIFHTRPIPHQKFMEDKLLEQQQRNLQNTSTLEPNIKRNAGNLRYIHILMWLLAYFLNRVSLKEVISLGVVTESEYQELQEAHDFFRMIRYGLHALAKRKEDRILSIHQKPLAVLFGYHSDSHNSIIQSFMQDYYQLTRKVILLNKIITRAIWEHIIQNDASLMISEDIQGLPNRHSILDIGVYNLPPTPENVMEALQHLSQSDSMEAFSSKSLRWLRESIEQFNAHDLRQNKVVKQSILKIFHNKSTLHDQLQDMRNVGFLDKYVPHFSTINGLMQFDLYHIHSVDQHTLMVLKNIQDIANGDYDRDAQFYQRLYESLSKPSLLFMAGFFHDIGKGSGRNHSIYGADIAYEFCTEHQLPHIESELVSWLVKEHLLISKTTKTKDIYDPKTIQDFCSAVETPERLQYLTLLTVADIKATNPKLWNDWNASLIKALYQSALHYFKHPTDENSQSSPQDETTQIQASIFKRSHFSSEEIETLKSLWKRWPDKYFLAHSRTAILWHSENILKHPKPERPIVFSRFNARFKQCEIAIYSPLELSLFYQITSLFDQMNLSIMDARQYTIEKGYALAEYLVISDGEKIKDPQQIERINTELNERLNHASTELPPTPPRIRKRARHNEDKHGFTPSVTTEISEHENYTELTIKALDQHGLLARISGVLYKLGLRVRYAKINTLGEKIEDHFYLNNLDFSKVTDQKLLDKLKADLLEIVT